MVNENSPSCNIVQMVSCRKYDGLFVFIKLVSQELVNLIKGLLSAQESVGTPESDLSLSYQGCFIASCKAHP